MTNGTASATSSTTNPSIGVIQNQNHVSNGVVNTAAPVNSAIGSEKISTTSNATSSSVTAPTNTSTTSFSSQRLPTYSNQASFNKEGGGGAQKAKKDTGIMGGGQQNQSGGGGYRSGGNKDHRARDKEKQTQQQQQTQQNHYHSSGQCSGSQNQNSRKKEKFQNSRDHSSQSRRGGPIHNNYTKNVEVTEMVKPIGFPQVPTPPVVAEKLVQTDPFENSIEHKEIAKKSTTKKRGEKVEENAGMLKKSHPKHMDTVLAFKEHDEWNKVELMCELLSFLDPVDLRLVGNCIEGSVRCYTNQMRPVEKTSNCSEPTASLPPFVCAPTNASNGGVPHPNSAAAGLQKHNIMSTFTGPMTQPPPGLPPIPSLGGLPVMMYPTTSDAFSSTPSSSSSNKEISSLPNGMVSPPNTTNSGGTTTPTDEEKNKNCQNGSVPTSTTPAASSPEAETPTAAPTQPEPPVPQDPALFLRSVQDLTSYLYILMSVCDSTNRKSAAKIADYMTNVILREKPQILERIPDPLDKIDVLQHIGKIVAAIVHHPAVSVDVKLKYMNMRDDFRAEIENLFQQYYADQRKIIESRLFEPSERGVGLEEEEGEESDDEMEDGDVRSRLTSTTNYYNPHGSSASAPPTFFITRFIGRQISGNDNLFLVEMSTSISSFDEDSKKLSTSCSTMDTTYPPSSGERIIPRMHRDATAAQMTQYINELSDLPARMMLSSVICEEFNGTRSRTEDVSFSLCLGTY
uniref:RNA-binding protein vts1-like alpha-helical domain-containing protein n=1 Tax=Caenorhabditis japonica TaxID=281687 RepID=A0A8R1DIF7_CAEJA